MRDLFYKDIYGKNKKRDPYHTAKLLLHGAMAAYYLVNYFARFGEKRGIGGDGYDIDFPGDIYPEDEPFTEPFEGVRMQLQVPTEDEPYEVQIITEGEFFDLMIQTMVYYVKAVPINAKEYHTALYHLAKSWNRVDELLGKFKVQPLQTALWLPRDSDSFIQALKKLEEKKDVVEDDGSILFFHDSKDELRVKLESRMPVEEESYKGLLKVLFEFCLFKKPVKKESHKNQIFSKEEFLNLISQTVKYYSQTNCEKEKEIQEAFQQLLDSWKISF